MGKRILTWGAAHVRLIWAIFLAHLAWSVMPSVALATEIVPSTEQINALTKSPLILIQGAVNIILGWFLYKSSCLHASNLLRVVTIHQTEMKETGERNATTLRELTTDFRSCVTEFGKMTQKTTERERDHLAIIATHGCMANELQAHYRKLLNQHGIIDETPNVNARLP